MKRSGAPTLLVAIAALSVTCSHPEPQDAAPAVVSVKVRAAQVQTLRDMVVVPGTIVPAPAADFTVVAPESGQIAEMPHNEGDKVKAGDLLVRFDVSSIRDDLNEKQHAADAAKLALDAAKVELAKQQSLFDQTLIPKLQVDAAAFAVKSAEATVTHADALLKASNTLASRAAVRAPFDGILLKRFHVEGEVVRASNDDPVLRFVDPTRLQISAHVTPGQALRITPGLEGTIDDMVSGTSAAATVVARPAAPDPNATSVEIRLAYASPAPTPLPALDAMVQAAIVLEVRDNALAIPTAAIQRTDATPFVMVAGADGKAHKRDIQAGISAGTLTQVLAGLSVGDQVIVSPLDQVSDGTTIEIER